MIDLKARVEELTAHIVDPIEKARKQRILTRALACVEVTPKHEELATDNGFYDGIPAINISSLRERESVKLAALREKRADIFDTQHIAQEDELNKRGKYGYTPLMKAVVEENFEEGRRLLEAGADVTITDNGNMTVYDKARGNVAMMALLAEYD